MSEKFRKYRDFKGGVDATSWACDPETEEELKAWRKLKLPVIVIDKEEFVFDQGAKPVRRTHGGFDNDIHLISSTLSTILGKHPLKAPVTFRANQPHWFEEKSHGLNQAGFAYKSTAFHRRSPAASALRRGARGPLHHLRAHLAGYKIPLMFNAVPELPLTASGKLKRGQS